MEKNKSGAPAKKAPARFKSFALYGPALIAALVAGTGQVWAQDTASAEATAAIAAWYTNDQADFGQRAYNSSCVACHGDAMLGIFSEYETAAKFLGFISGSMPAENPGSLPTEDYLAIVAYLMRDMGFPAGDTPLPNNRDILLEIQPKASHEALGFALDTAKP